MTINQYQEGSLFDTGDNVQNDNREEVLIHVPTPQERADKEKEINKLTLDEMKAEYAAYLDFAKKYKLYTVDSKGRKVCPQEISKVFGRDKILKRDWVTFYAVLSDPSNIFTLMHDISQKESELLQMIAFHHCMFVKDIKEMMGGKVTAEKRFSGFWPKEILLSQYAFFYKLGFTVGPETKRTYYKQTYLKIRPDIRLMLMRTGFRTHLEMNTLDTLPEGKALCTYNTEASTLLNLPTLAALFEARQIEIGRGKVSAASVKNVEKACSFSEFFPKAEKENSRLCALFIANVYTVFATAKGTGKQNKPEEDIKTIFTGLLGYMYYLLPILLPHIKGFKRSYMYDSHADDLARMINAVVSQYAQGGWLSLADLTVKVRTLDEYAEENCMLLPEQYFAEMPLKNSYTGMEIYYDGVIANITHPFIKAYLFLMAAFGVVEIAYEEKPGEFESCYLDTLRFVRLTDLGKYVFGITPRYEHNTAQEKQFFEVDESNLIVKSLEDKNPFLLLLENMANPISKKMYKVTYESFLDNCTTLSDIINKEQMFRDCICKEPPAVWENFFQEVKKRCQPLGTSKKKYTVMEIPSDNKELQRTIVSDPTIRKYTVKAEGYMLLVETAYKGKVADALKKYGYLL